MNTLTSLASFCFVNVYIRGYNLLSFSLCCGLLISVQAVVFKAPALIFRDLFYLCFIKGISLQRTNKRLVPNLNVRNPVLRGYKQISCPAAKGCCWSGVCAWFFTLHWPWLPLRDFVFPSQEGDRVGHHRRCSPEDGWTAGRRRRSALGVPRVHLSLSLRGATPASS